MLWLIVGGVTLLALAMFCILIGVLLAFGKKKVDKDEDEFEQMGAIFSKDLEWPEAGEICYKAGRLNLFGVRAAIKAAWKQYAGDKVWGLITKITVKNIPGVLHHVNHADGPSQRLQVAKAIADELPGLMQAKDTAVMFGEAIESEVLGTPLDADAKAKMVIISQRFNAWGLGAFGTIFYAIGSDNESAVKVSIDAIFADAQSDDALKAAIKNALAVGIVPRLKQDPTDKQWLTNLVAAT